MSANGLRWQLHDTHPADAAHVDAGLAHYNEVAAPLAEVQPLVCLVYDAGDRLLGGAVGRTWGSCCELQQLWVDEAHRRRGIGAGLIGRFEQRAVERGCTTFYLETFSFQAPSLYRGLGYRTAYAIAGFPDGIVKQLMVKERA